MACLKYLKCYVFKVQISKTGSQLHTKTLKFTCLSSSLSHTHTHIHTHLHTQYWFLITDMDRKHRTISHSNHKKMWHLPDSCCASGVTERGIKGRSGFSLTAMASTASSSSPPALSRSMCIVIVGSNKSNMMKATKILPNENICTITGNLNLLYFLLSLF